MPKGPRGERRPAAVIGNAVHVMRIATGEIEDTIQAPDPAKERNAPPWRLSRIVRRV